jgi:hypothetical protein
MHIGIGAAIFILGVLFLATSKAGLKVLGVAVVVIGVGGGGVIYWAQQQDQKQHAAWAANRASGVCNSGKSLQEEIDLGCYEGHHWR